MQPQIGRKHAHEDDAYQSSSKPNKSQSAQQFNRFDANLNVIFQDFKAAPEQKQQNEFHDRSGQDLAGLRLGNKLRSHAQSHLEGSPLEKAVAQDSHESDFRAPFLITDREKSPRRLHHEGAPSGNVHTTTKKSQAESLLLAHQRSRADLLHAKSRDFQKMSERTSNIDIQI